MACSGRCLPGAAFVALIVGWTCVCTAQTRTIWDGVFTEAQAARGEQVYAQSCAGCHQKDLLGEKDAPPLAGPQFSSRWKGVTADDMLQTIRRTMPQEAPESLSTEAYLEVISYVLKANGAPAGGAALPQAREALREIRVVPR